METNSRITAFITHLILLCAINEAFKLQRHKFLNCDIIDSNLNSNEISDVFNLPVKLSNDTRIKCVSKRIVTNEELLDTINEFSSQNYEYDIKVYDTKDENIIYNGTIVEKEIYERVQDINRSMTFEIVFTITANEGSKVRGILESIEYKFHNGKHQTYEANTEYYNSNAYPTRDKKVIEANSPKITNLGALEIISTETEETTVIADLTVKTEANSSSEITESSESSTMEAVTSETIVPITEKIFTDYISIDIGEPVNKVKASVFTKEGVPFYTLPIFIAVTTIASFIIAVVIVTLCLYHLYAPKIDSPDHNANGPELVNVTRVKTVENRNESNSVNNLNSTDDFV